MKKVLYFTFSFIDKPFPSRELTFRKEVTEIIPIGTKYLPFGNELRAGAIVPGYVVDESLNEFVMLAVFQMPFEKYSSEEGEYIRKNMKEHGWLIFRDNIDKLD
ncbi:MAG: hypothetical protein NTW62_01350 [Candidatus Nomurabacteria bacterium]|nr:hypothetical protein [Candidatus Nomurabacteria bacterium]